MVKYGDVTLLGFGLRSSFRAAGGSDDGVIGGSAGERATLVGGAFERVTLGDCASERATLGDDDGAGGGPLRAVVAADSVRVVTV